MFKKTHLFYYIIHLLIKVKGYFTIQDMYGKNVRLMYTGDRLWLSKVKTKWGQNAAAGLQGQPDDYYTRSQQTRRFQTISVPQVSTTPDHPPEMILYAPVGSSDWKKLRGRNFVLSNFAEIPSSTAVE
jgi:hypothetical protein